MIGTTLWDSALRPNGSDDCNILKELGWSGTQGYTRVLTRVILDPMDLTLWRVTDSVVPVID